MEFKLVPVDSIPEYLNVYCGFKKDNHEHLPIIWRNTNRSVYIGWASWEKKYGMVNFYHLYHEYLRDKKDNGYHEFIDDFLRVYYHEFLHLFFKFRLMKVYFKGKTKTLRLNEKIVDLLAVMLYTEEILHVGNWANEVFKGEF